VAGVFMASADGVGRHFPLSVFCCGEGGDRFLGPLDETMQGWCDAMEEFLLGALEPELDFDDYLGRLALLPLPPREPTPDADPSFRAILGSDILPADAEETVDSAFQRLTRAQARRRHGASSYWWTIGGEDFAPMAMAADGWPDRNLLGPMMSRILPAGP
jgi:type VI secretion system protein ImpM